jgi:hypothetical protein
MTTQLVLVLAAVVAPFAIFLGTLGYVQVTTRAHA